MPETETIVATTAPTRRRAARKAATVAESTPKRSSRARKTAEKPSSSAETPASPTRPRASRTCGRRTAAAPAPSDPVALATGLSAPEPPPVGPAETDLGREAQPTPESPIDPAPVPALSGTPDASSEASEEAPRQPEGGEGVAHDPDPPVRPETVVRQVDARHPFSRSRPARPTFKQTVLRAAEERFRGDRVREPITEDQVDELLVLLHEPGQSRSLTDATYDFLRRGMSRQHAEVQIEKLRGTFVPRDARVAA